MNSKKQRIEEFTSSTMAVLSIVFISFSFAIGVYAAIASIAGWPLQVGPVWFGVALACLRSAVGILDEII